MLGILILFFFFGFAASRETAIKVYNSIPTIFLTELGVEVLKSDSADGSLESRWDVKTKLSPTCMSSTRKAQLMMHDTYSCSA